MKKIFSLVLAVIMMMTVTAFAADMTTTGEVGPFTTPDTPTVQDKSITLKKELKFYNPEDCTVNAPTITYNYAITAGDANKSITDAANKHDPAGAVTVPTKAGVGNPEITESVSWTPGTNHTASSTGESEFKNITVNFTDVTFTGAGVYRYVITETVTYTGTGVTETKVGNTAGSHTRYLDVYVKDGSTAGTYDIYGYTCFYNNNDIADNNKTTSAVKTQGFVAGTTDGSTAVTADSYYTYNVTIGKTLTGDNAKLTNKFPFTVTFQNTNITANVDIIGSASNDTATASDTASSPLNTTITATPSIANGGTAVYTGIPVGTTVTVKEKNNVTGTTYTSVGTITTKGTGDTDADSKVITYNTESNVATIASTTADSIPTANKTVQFANDLVLISPTGYVARIAPYALMLAAGAILLILGFKRRTRKEEA